MSAYIVKYESYNRKNYEEVVNAKNEAEARKVANYMTHKHDDRDRIISIEEANELNVYGGK